MSDLFTLLDVGASARMPTAKPYDTEEFRCGDSDTTGEPYYVIPPVAEMDSARVWATIHERVLLKARIAELEAEVTSLRRECVATGDAAEMAVEVAKGLRDQRNQAAAERDSLKAELDACAKRLRKFDDCIPTVAANTTLRLERANHTHELAAAVAEEREACAALMERMAPNGSKLVGLAAAIRARGKS